MQKSGTSSQRRDLNPPLTFQERFRSDGILCDVNILFNVMKVPPEEGKSGYSNQGVRGGKRGWSSKLADAMVMCLGDVLNGFSKEELKNYTVQLLLNTCSLYDLNDLDVIDGDGRPVYREGREEILNHPSEPTRANTHPQTGRPYNFPSNANREFSKGGSQKIGGMSTSDKECYSETSACTNEGDIGRFFTRSDNSSTNNNEESNFSRIMRLIDILCELRPLAEHSSIQNRLGESCQQFGSSAREPVEKRGAACNARRRLFQYEPTHRSNNLDCQPLPTKTPSNLEWPTQGQPCTYEEWMEGIGPHGFTPFHGPYTQKDEDICQPCLPQDSSYCTPSATPSPRAYFERSNVDTVIHRRQQGPYTQKDEDIRQPCLPQDLSYCSPSATPSPRAYFERSNDDTVIQRIQQPSMQGTRTMRSPRSPPSSTIRPKNPPTAKPRSRTAHQSLGGQPCPLVTPRVALDNPYLRMNKSL